ncbi:hypothetical protein pb186bvf_017480 [Paramecium bursaria]
MIIIYFRFLPFDQNIYSFSKFNVDFSLLISDYDYLRILIRCYQYIIKILLTKTFSFPSFTNHQYLSYQILQINKNYTKYMFYYIKVHQIFQT